MHTFTYTFAHTLDRFYHINIIFDYILFSIYIVHINEIFSYSIKLRTIVREFDELMYESVYC